MVRQELQNRLQRLLTYCQNSWNSPILNAISVFVEIIYWIKYIRNSTNDVTVISGDISLGMGDKLDETKSAHLIASGFAEAPARMNHFAWTKSGAVVQVSADGPFAMTYVNPTDDPTHH